MIEMPRAYLGENALFSLEDCTSHIPTLDAQLDRNHGLLEIR
jgi:hypothetical protein